MRFMIRGRSVMLLVCLGIGLSGCENLGAAAQSKTVQGGALGTLLGGGAGAIIGNQTGHAGAGTAIGAGVGAIGGAMVGNAMEEQERRLSSQSLPAAKAAKFCPVGGEAYSEDIKYCPIHGAELKVKQ